MTTQRLSPEEFQSALAANRARSAEAFLNQSPTTTPSFPNEIATGAVPSLRPNPGMLRALLQPIIFFTLTEPVDAFEAGDTVALQFWGRGPRHGDPTATRGGEGTHPDHVPREQTARLHRGADPLSQRFARTSRTRGRDGSDSRSAHVTRPTSVPT